MADERQALTIDRIVGECVEAGMPTGFEGTLRGSLADAWRAALAARETETLCPTCGGPLEGAEGSRCSRSACPTNLMMPVAREEPPKDQLQ